jgi:Fungal Zn(2)-Cys(6) binuclear cluster domain
MRRHEVQKAHRCIISHSPARSRPCGHCRRKGRTAEQCVDGCEACRQARARCEGGAPCTRCMSMHLNCVDGTTPPLTAAFHLQGEAGGGSGGRAQLACKSCYRGNKKVSIVVISGDEPDRQVAAAENNNSFPPVRGSAPV